MSETNFLKDIVYQKIQFRQAYQNQLLYQYHFHWFVHPCFIIQTMPVTDSHDLRFKLYDEKKKICLDDLWRNVAGIFITGHPFNLQGSPWQQGY